MLLSLAGIPARHALLSLPASGKGTAFFFCGFLQKGLDGMTIRGSVAAG